MKKIIVAAFAALALFGCTEPSDTPTVPPQVAELMAQPTPQPAAVTNADINHCKVAWATAWASEHNTTVAAAERYARRISTTPATTLRINGTNYTFNANTQGATVWSTCRKSLKAERLTQVQQQVEQRNTEALQLTVAALRAENRQLLRENRVLRNLAYQNPDEPDPDKLISNQARVTALEGQVEELEGFNLMDGILLVFGTVVGLTLGLVVGAKLWRRRRSRHGGLGSP